MYSNIRELKVGRKYTFVGFTYTGAPWSVQLRLLEIRHNALGDDSYFLMYRKFPNHVRCNMRLSADKQFIIWEGLHTPDAQVQVATYIKDSDHGHVQKLKRWPSYDPRYMQRAKLSVSVPPLVENIKPVFGYERLLDLCTVIS